MVQFKSKQALLEDMKAVYKLFHYEITTLDEALAQIDKVMKYPSPTGKQKQHLAFYERYKKDMIRFLRI